MTCGKLLSRLRRSPGEGGKKRKGGERKSVKV